LALGRGGAGRGGAGGALMMIDFNQGIVVACLHTQTTQFKLHFYKFIVNFGCFAQFIVNFGCFETHLFVSVVAIWIRNTETNRNKPKK
jgi:hypothetical protein